MRVMPPKEARLGHAIFPRMVFLFLLTADYTDEYGNRK